MGEQRRHTARRDAGPKDTGALTRRHFLSGIAGFAALGLVACGGATTPTSAPVASGAPSVAPGTGSSTAPVASGAPSVAGTARATGAATGTRSTPAIATVTRSGSPVATVSAATPVAQAVIAPQNAFPATVTHQYGTVTIRQAPKRILSLGYNDQDFLLALNAIPVGILRWFADQPRAVGPWAEAALGSAQPAIIPTTELDYENVVQLAPDLIVGIYRNMTQEEYDRLSQIAPTITMPAGYVPFGVPWRDEARLVGATLAQSAAMETIIAGVEAQFTAAARANPQFAGKTVSLILPAADGQYYAYAKQDSRTRFMESLGFTLAPALDALEQTAFYSTLSRERIDLLEADLLIAIANTPASAEALKADQLLQRLNVVKNGRSIVLSDANIYQAFSMNTVLSIPYAIEQFVPQIAQIIRP